ncbi:MAG: hypothetical protein EAZ20_07465 [Bacteroidetes bacterium]|nr:MAG: hypothetical protein EAZ20_07465 [Bacteroidota bacterium]
MISDFLSTKIYMKKCVLFLMCMMCIQYTQAQNKKLMDSLQLAYKTSKIDTIKIIIQLELAFRYRNNYPDSTLKYAQKALLYSQKVNFFRGEGQAWNTLGFGYIRKEQYQTAHDCYAKGLISFEKNRYERGIASTYTNMGVLYERQANFPKALEYYQKSLEIEERTNNRYGMAKTLGNIGNLYGKQGNYAESLKYQLRCLEVFKGIGRQDDIATALGNVGAAYYYLNDLKQAVEYYEKSLNIHKKTNEKMGIAYQLNNIGEVYYNQENFPKAIEYLQQSVTAHEEINDKQGLIYPLTCLGISYQKQKDYDKSIQYAQKAFDIAQEIKVWNELKDVAKVLYESHKLKGDFDKALLYHEKYKIVNDSIYNKDKAKAFAKIEAKAELAQKDKEVALSKINAEREKNARLASEKQAEADNFLSLAREEKDKRKADSLLALSQKSQLEANVLKAQERTLKAEAKAKNAEIIKEKQEKDFQQKIIYVALMALIAVLLLAYMIYKGQQKEKKAKEEIATQKEEIQTQAEQLDTSNKTKDRIFAILAHDLRNPIMAFQGVAKQVEMFLRKDKPERVLALTETIDKYSQNLNSLLDNLLNWALVQRNELTFLQIPLEIKKEIDICLKGFEALADAQKITLYNEISPELVIHLDKNVLQTIIRNLVSNALKFTPENGKIIVGNVENKENPQENWQLFVKDTGVGISSDVLPALFKIENKQSTQGIRGEKGIGIGLSLCYELARLNNVKINVESTLGEGTVFYIAPNPKGEQTQKTS